MKDEIVARLNERVGQVLDVAEAAIPSDRFRAFRKVVLSAFGKSGFIGDLEQIMPGSDVGKAGIGAGRNDAARKGGVP